MDVDELRKLELFEGLSEAQLAELVAVGTERPVEPGVELFREGEHADHWWVLLSGAIVLVRHVGREETEVGTMNVPGRWAGGFRAWDEQGVYLATGRGLVAGSVFSVPAEALREKSRAWFPLAGHLIEGLYRTARTIESTARQRESLVTLGTLAAGLAHEINNPAAATTRAVDALESACSTLLDSLTHLAAGNLSATEFLALDALRRELRPPVVVPSAMQRADAEESIATWLERRGVAQSWVLAPALVGAGADTAWCARVADAVSEQALTAGLEWAASTVSAQALLGQVKDSTRRVSELVAAVRSYSQVDRAAVQQVRVAEGVESTLVMLGHKIRDGGVTVVRDYGTDVPEIQAYAGELNQVWTNLVDNAVDAMENTGTLTISTRPDGDGVLVEVADTGTGMAPEVVARAFEAFYSTKDVGKGTGLGLDIAYRIVVNRHGGTIDIESGPGGTTMRVRLPASPPRS